MWCAVHSASNFTSVFYLFVRIFRSDKPMWNSWTWRSCIKKTAKNWRFRAETDRVLDWKPLQKSLSTLYLNRWCWGYWAPFPQKIRPIGCTVEKLENRWFQHIWPLWRRFKASIYMHMSWNLAGMFLYWYKTGFSSETSSDSCRVGFDNLSKSASSVAALRYPRRSMSSNLRKTRFIRVTWCIPAASESSCPALWLVTLQLTECDFVEISHVNMHFAVTA